MKLSPLNKLFQRGFKCYPEIREFVFHFRRNLFVDCSPHDRLLFQATELLDEHFLGREWNGSFQLGKAHHALVEKVKHDHHFPPAFKKLESLFRGIRRPVVPGVTRCAIYLTVW